ncbi:CPBP family intramembrane glutamic endopeptidase [Cryobacterium zhongshanensis]|uniref:CPBP family glutamic-type intramembrane protease n=1 Tax=Cryobacterium zhongshanensis TaxID=2928153 RepID=A0AA41UHX2_9MICO|nr:CPBP family intramembrane glutamic endopeptidase [Cryobacterium zhongshanensis]MCI4658899.1 CPBP family glutamic-type intramembrane protease [Cryobacterium zhongshanensis]
MTNKRMVAMLATFLAVATVASPLLSLLQAAVGPDPEVLRLPTFATAVGAAVVWLFWRESLNFPHLTGRSVMRVAILAVVFAAVTLAVLIVLNVAEGSPWSPLDVSTLPVSLGLVLVLQLLGVAGEEVGWRGVVQPLLENRFSLVWSGIITGALFGLGHFYVLLAAGVIVYLAFVVAAIGLSVTLAVLTVGKSFAVRVLIATFFHWLVNLAMLLAFSSGDESLLWTINTAIATGLVAVLAVVVTRGSKERKSDQSETEAVAA